MAAVSGVDRNASDGASTSLVASSAKPGEMECKLCLTIYPKEFFYKLEQCDCYACEQCMTDYVEAMLNQDRVLQLSCPVKNCPGVCLSTEEVRRLLDAEGFARFQQLKYMKEVEVDPTKTFCPRPGCENVCQMLAQPPPEYQRKISSRSPLPIEAWQMRRVATAISCSKCQHDFCSVCKTRWHDGLTCEQANAQLKPEERSVLFISGSGRRQRTDTASQQSIKSVSTIIESDLPKFIDLINEDSEDDDELTTKPCPVCALPIERDLGCARIECARCNHNFCWHCLEILDEDFMWMHYETGPCKDRMGVPAGQVHTYRLTAILTMAGIGLLMLVASPVIIIAAPCLLCYKFAPKDKSDDEDQQSETSSLQSSSSADRTSRYTRSENEQPRLAASTSASASATASSTRRSPYAEEYCPPKKSESIFSSCRIL